MKHLNKITLENSKDELVTETKEVCIEVGCIVYNNTKNTQMN